MMQKGGIKCFKFGLKVCRTLTTGMRPPAEGVAEEFPLLRNMLY